MQSSPDTRSWTPIATALREIIIEKYSLALLRGDILAGITVGLIAVPLAMALAIASGVPPQHGIYTSIIAGAVIAIFGGSRFNISGPTAAFVVILLPIVHKYGLGGLLVTTVMAGIILVIMGAARFGRLIEFIPYPVTTGFTAGIAVVIAALQLKDFFGLDVTIHGEHFLDKMGELLTALPTAHWEDLLIGALTLTVLIVWPRFKSAIPGHLVALIVGTLVAYILSHGVPGFQVATIGTRFTYDVDGVTGFGIPALPPLFVLPWELPNALGQPIGLSLELLRELLPAAFTVAMLGAIESLLCSVVADGLTGAKHNPNSELVAQGLGNIAAPFFGGITATAAIARTAANIRAGGRSPVASVVHALTVLLAVVIFADLLAYVPMAALAALLLMVAWNMSEARHFVNIVRVAPRSDVAVLLACFSLTVLFDMVIAVGVGVVLASVLFIKRMADLTGATLVQNVQRQHPDLPPQVAVYDINGPLFFGAAEKAISVLSRVHTQVKVVIIDMADVPVLDMTGIIALDSVIKKLNKKNVGIIIANLSGPIYRKLLRAGFRKEPGMLACTSTMKQAAEEAISMLKARGTSPDKQTSNASSPHPTR